MKIFILFFCLSSATLLTSAQSTGTLDPKFGRQGIVIDNDFNNIPGSSIRITHSGRILSGTQGIYREMNNTFRIDAFLPNGTVDSSFGENGSAYAIFPGMTLLSDAAGIASLAVLQDGKILASGFLRASGSSDDIAFARFNPDGTIDKEFGTNGVTTTGFGYTNEGAGSLTVEPDGKFLIGGSVFTNFEQNIYQFYTARFLPDGSKDKSYGNEGSVISASRGAATSIKLQKDEKIVAAGYSGNYFGSSKFHIERYNPDGSIDKSFGTNGFIDVKFGSSNSNVINDIVVQPDGGLLVTGKTSGKKGEPLLTLARFNADGSTDNTFGNEGFVTTSLSEYGGEGLRLWLTGEQEDKIVVAGNNLSYSASYGNFVLTGYQADGSLDLDFGQKGITVTDLGGVDNVLAADKQPDGKILLGGSSQSYEDFESRRCFARYNGYPQKVSLLVRIKRWQQNHTLSWKGLPADDNIAYYSVEQSSNSSKGFTQVAKVSGTANLKDYSITNTHLLQGNNYYRIKAISTDGVIRYSEVVSADNTANAASVYPNPAKNYVTVQGLPANETANISIKDGSGTVLARGVSTGSVQYRSSLGSNMQPGTYYLNITTGSKTEVLKFVKE